MGRFIQISMGSGAELSYHLLLARDLGLLSKPDFLQLRSELGEVIRMLSALSQKVKPIARVVQLKAKS